MVGSGRAGRPEAGTGRLALEKVCTRCPQPGVGRAGSPSAGRKASPTPGAPFLKVWPTSRTVLRPAEHGELCAGRALQGLAQTVLHPELPSSRAQLCPLAKDHQWLGVPAKASLPVSSHPSQAPFATPLTTCVSEGAQVDGTRRTRGNPHGHGEATSLLCTPATARPPG